MLVYLQNSSASEMTCWDVVDFGLFSSLSVIILSAIVLLLIYAVILLIVNSIYRRLRGNYFRWFSWRTVVPAVFVFSLPAIALGGLFYLWCCCFGYAPRP